MALRPLLKTLLTATLPTPRLGLLLPEFDRLLQVCPPCIFAVRLTHERL